LSPKFKFKFELFKLGLKVELGSYPEVSKVLKSMGPKFGSLELDKLGFWRSS
jgi:hypothetical protein